MGRQISLFLIQYLYFLNFKKMRDLTPKQSRHIIHDMSRIEVPFLSNFI